MEVITITANPAIDMTIHVDGWQRDAVNRAQAVDITVGGKGLTVAINLADAGISTSATGVIRRQTLCEKKPTKAGLRRGETRAGQS